METYRDLNELLVRLFHDILDIEEKSISTQGYKDVTNNDIHVIETVGIGEPKNMSTIAKELKVTVGTLTIAMNGLVKKGYVVRERSEEDRRVVNISLSPKGRELYEKHIQFHLDMIAAVRDQMTEEEAKALTKGLTKLNRWFRSLEET